MARGDEQEKRPISELLKELSQETATLVHQEVELAKAELSQKGRRAKMGALTFGVAVTVGLGAFGAFTAFLILGLAAVVPAWLSGLVVAVVYAAIAAGLGMQGKDQLQKASPALPEQTLESVKEDVEWAKSRARSARR